MTSSGEAYAAELTRILRGHQGESLEGCVYFRHMVQLLDLGPDGMTIQTGDRLLLDHTYVGMASRSGTEIELPGTVVSCEPWEGEGRWADDSAPVYRAELRFEVDELLSPKGQDLFRWMASSALNSPGRQIFQRVVLYETFMRLSTAVPVSIEAWTPTGMVIELEAAHELDAMLSLGFSLSGMAMDTLGRVRGLKPLDGNGARSRYLVDVEFVEPPGEEPLERAEGGAGRGKQQESPSDSPDSAQESAQEKQSPPLSGIPPQSFDSS